MASAQSMLEVSLPIGLLDAGGRRHRRAAVRKMTGQEEALLYDAALGTGRLVTELIRSCLLRVGEIESIDHDIVRGLYSLDRKCLLVAIRRFSLGDKLRAIYRCPRCQLLLVLEEDLATLEARSANDDQPLETTVMLEDGYAGADGQRHREVVLAQPRGADEEVVSRWIPADPAAAQEALLLRCIRRFGELPRAALDAYGSKILCELTARDRLCLETAFGAASAGVSFERPLTCDTCGASFRGVMDVSSFFALG
jgi:hypothetical protein